MWNHAIADKPLDNIDDNFPMESYREGQKEAIEFAVKAFSKGKKIVILECPTGSGKSPIGMTLANMSTGAYYLTITKILQDQLVTDFGDEITELKGRNAYPCTFWDRRGKDLVSRKGMKQITLDRMLMEKPGCDAGYCRRQKSKNNYKCTDCFPVGESNGTLAVLPVDMEYSACPYYEQVYQAINNKKVSMNFSSFLYQTQMTNRFDEPRGLMVIDEAHNLEPQLLDFVSLTFNDIHLQKEGIVIPEYNDPHQYAEWFLDNKIDIILNSLIQKARQDDNIELEDEIKRLYQKFQMFMDHIAETGSDWVVEFTESDRGGGLSHRSVTLKPVFIQKFADELLFKYADKILLMSATILDVGVVCNSLGVSRDDVAAYRMKNRFPVANRPIYIKPVAKMTGGVSKMNSDWGEKLVTGVEEILELYEGKRGIIHTHNFAIANLLIEKCKADFTHRFFFQKDFFNNKKKMLEEHAKSEDGIIVAPAMHEGIDLHGDLSRFQIICKVPYANCFDDKQLAARVEVDRRYYTWITALKLVQSYGRSIRSKDDYADTYIIDESIYYFMKQANKMLPDWFKEAVREYIETPF